jgi:hypothetical protein
MMAVAQPRDLVPASIRTGCGHCCIDVFKRTDGSFGFEEYRRDPEDPRGWAPGGGYRGQRFGSEDQARDGAAACVPWFREASLRAGS